MRVDFTAWLDVLSWAGTAHLARDGALQVNCTEKDSQRPAEAGEQPPSIAAMIVEGRVYATDSRITLPAGRTWMVADWGARQAVPAAMFALLDSTLALEDPGLRAALHEDQALDVGTGRTVTPPPWMLTANGRRDFPDPRPSARLREWYRGAGKPGYLKFGLMSDLGGVPTKFAAEFYQPAVGRYVMESDVTALGLPVEITAPAPAETVPVTDVLTEVMTGGQ